MTGGPVTILDGPFMGFKGTVLREKGDQLVVRVNVFGRDTEVTLDRRVLGLTPPTMDALEAEVVEAVARRGFRQRRFGFWQQQARRTPPMPMHDLLNEHERFARALLREEEAAQAAALKDFRAGFAHLDPAARDAKWAAERERWTAWRAEARAVTATFDASATEDASALMHRAEAERRLRGFDVQLPPEPQNPDLEAQILRDPDADAPFLVYGDWLSAQGDARGELIALQAAGEEKKHAEAALRAKLAPQLLGPLAALEGSVQAKWRLGFLEHLSVEATRADEAQKLSISMLVGAALRLPSARFLRSLSIGAPSAHEGPMIDAVHRILAASPPPLLRKLAFFTNTEEEMLSWTSAGLLDALGPMFPKLEELSVHAGALALSEPAFPRLRVLALRAQLEPATLAAIVAADWPSLEALTVWSGSAAYGCRVQLEDLVSVLACPRLPRLKRLGLENNEHTDALCEAVLGAGLVPQLESLSLAMGTMTETGAQRLIAGAERLRHLKVLDVGDNFLTGEVLAALKAALPQVTGAPQRSPEHYGDAVHRYASVSE